MANTKKQQHKPTKPTELMEEIAEEVVIERFAGNRIEIHLTMQDVRDLLCAAMAEHERRFPLPR